jgi:para-nitrobenzyl esterase
MPISSKILIRAPLLVVVLATSATTLAQSPRAQTESGAISGVHESGLTVSV